MLRQAADATGLKVVSEVIAEDQMDTAAKYCDMFQIGARNMQNFRLLKAVGRSGVPVLLKRGIASTIEEWLDAAEYIMSEAIITWSSARGASAPLKPLPGTPWIFPRCP